MIDKDMNTPFDYLIAGRCSYILAASLAIAAAGCGGESPQSPAAESPEPSATQKTLDELQAKYDELTAERLDDPVQWASDDLENIGDWEYRVVELPSAASAAELETALNELGNDRWELVWIEETSSGSQAILKRPAVSLLSKIPLSQLGRLIMGSGDSEQ